MMNLRKLIKATFLLAIGLVLHALIPSFLGYIKPDFLLALFFIALLDLDTYPEVIVVSVAAGLLSGMTSSIPGGLFANLVDKIITGPVVYSVFSMLKQRMKMDHIVLLLGFGGTMISGLIFIACIVVIGSLPIAQVPFLLGVVTITGVLNSVFVMFLRKIMPQKYNRGSQM